MKSYGATHVEPGNGFTGTTPLATVQETAELPAVLYLSEISHMHNGRGHVFGGGLYVDRVRGHYDLKARVGKNLAERSVELIPDEGAVAATCALMGPATSIYFNTGLGLQSAGNAFGFAFLVAMVAMFFVAYVIAQFARRLPSSGFAYTFSVNGLGSRLGFLTGWLLVGGYAMLSPMLLAAIGYFLHLFFTLYFGLNIAWGLFSIVVGILIFLLTCMGVNQSVRVALVMLVIEVVVMLAFFVTVLIHGGAQGITFAAFNPRNTLRPGDWSGIGTAILWAILMFVGFESAATLGEETKDPTKNIPKALFYAVIGIGIFFLIGAFTAVVGYGPSHISSVVASIAKGNNPWDVLFTRYWGTGASVILMLVILNSIFANLLSGFNAVVRIIYAMGREQYSQNFSVMYLNGDRCPSMHPLFTW
ncbi:amino acid permease [Alicyclobacillus dauci]|uniref:Amino acid permease n=1 Tax=Alicyclobacillus dauci TaxID=1475485 RepID=A0ABY6Z1V6_9BACL|nr:amino acid permease [Alicyclobacillus dauci]WAH36811.1 amino acid permease [Alicyclobacillus dauci]